MLNMFYSAGLSVSLKQALYDLLKEYKDVFA